MGPDAVLDQEKMENFFQTHLTLFPGAVSLERLMIYPHSRDLIISHAVRLAKYEVTFRNAAGEQWTVVLRGSSGPGAKRQKAFHIVDNLWRNGFSEGSYGVPRPLGYFPELGLFLYENVAGQTMLQAFQSDTKNYNELITAGIDWLAAYHQRVPRKVPEAKFDWREDEDEFNTLMSNLQEKFSTQVERIKRAVDTLRRQERVLLDRDSFCLVHGDYQPNNIICSDNRTVVIDFNDAYLFDELFDVAYYITQVKFMFRRFHQADISSLLPQMEQRYFDRRGLKRDALAEKKLALFTAKTLLHIKILTTHELGAKILTEIENNAEKTI